MPPLLGTVTQTALVVRLFGLLAVLVLTIGRELTVGTLVGIVAAGITSFAGLTRPEVLEAVRRHPSLALVDLGIMTAAIAVTGVDSPLVLVLLPTALLLGLWVDRIAGAIVIVCLLAVYVLALGTRTFPDQRSFLAVVVVPFVFVTLWMLGMAIVRAVEGERRAQAVLRDAVASAAAAGERTALAREIHDSVAKTLQGVVLTSAALPQVVERDPAAAAEQAREIQGMSTQAVHELRQIMSSLRERHTVESLSVAVAETAMAWQATTGREVTLHVAEGLDTEDDTVRHELVQCLSEALDNVHRHARTDEVEVMLSAPDADAIRLTVRDRGIGMDKTVLGAAAAAGHHGVTGMRERMARIGGVADIASAPGRGTTVTLAVHREGLVER